MSAASEQEEFEFRKRLEDEQTQVPKSSVGDIASKVGKYATGLATGAGEAMNPLAVPHGLEVLARAPFQGFEQARKDAILPELRISDVAPALRTAVRAPFSDKSTGEVYDEEKKSQENYEKNFLPEGSKDVGEVGTNVLNLGLLIRDLGKLANFGKRANEARVAALGGGKTAVKKLLKDDKIQDLGEQLSKDDIMGPLTSRTQIEANLEKANETYGKTIGDIVKKADKAGGEGGFIPADAITEKAINEVWTPLAKRSTTRAAADKVATEIDAFAQSHKGQNLTLDQVQKFKKDLSDTQKMFERAGDNPTVQGYKGLYNVFNKTGEEALDALKIPAGDLNTFQKAKKGYGLTTKALDMVSDRNAANAVNRMYSLTDYGAGAAGTMAQAARGGNMWQSLMTGLASGGANKFLRNRGNQLSASGWETLSKLINGKAPGAATFAVEGMGPVNLLSRRPWDKSEEE